VARGYDNREGPSPAARQGRGYGLVVSAADLLERRLIFVTGKGGVGKSTVAIALGLVAARRGLRTIVAEVGGDDRVARSLQPAAAGDSTPAGGSTGELQLGPHLFTISIDPQRAMEEYLRVKAGPFGQALGHSRLFQALAMATPGMRELLTIGKVWELAQLERRTRGAAPYDLVVVDAPATGHGVGILRTPRKFADIARVGPIAHQGETIATTIADRSFTGVVAVATPEEMPVNETLSLHEALVEDGLDVDAVIVNARYPERFAEHELALARAALNGDGTGSPLGARAALRAALSEQARATVQTEQADRLERAFPGRLLTLPFVFEATLGREQLELLADVLAGEL
jgi:anion-transporting  ArsA/GET3 family ATPase